MLSVKFLLKATSFLPFLAETKECLLDSSLHRSPFELLSMSLFPHMCFYYKISQCMLKVLLSCNMLPSVATVFCFE